MYKNQIKDINTITWHNLHFILEHYSNEILSIVTEIIEDGENRDTHKRDEQTLLSIKSEVITTVKTLKAMHTVVNHHRMLKTQHKETIQ